MFFEHFYRLDEFPVKFLIVIRSFLSIRDTFREMFDWFLSTFLSTFLSIECTSREISDHFLTTFINKKRFPVQTLIVFWTFFFRKKNFRWNFRTFLSLSSTSSKISFVYRNIFVDGRYFQRNFWSFFRHFYPVNFWLCSEYFYQ